MDDETQRVQDDGEVGSEGEGSADRLPFLPDSDDETPVGDTDQHSQAPSPPAQTDA